MMKSEFYDCKSSQLLFFFLLTQNNITDGTYFENKNAINYTRKEKDIIQSDRQPRNLEKN